MLLFSRSISFVRKVNSNAIFRFISVARLESGFILLRINLQRCDVCEYGVNIKRKQRLIDLTHLKKIFNRFIQGQYGG